jgi:cytochrome c biogenesis protein CcdA/thiol-disulfide isomerase/thioredoxin
MGILLIFAFLAGVVTVLSPCILPVLPILLSGGAAKGSSRPLGIVLGVIVSFTFFTLALKSLVEFAGINAEYLRLAAIFIIAFFGLTLLFPQLGNFFARATAPIEKAGTKIQDSSEGIKSGFFGGFILGLALGLVWTPCAGPILAAIVTLVAINNVNSVAVLMTLSYSLGAAIPMFLIAYGGQKITHASRFFAKHAEGIRRIFGIAMLAAAFAIFMNWDIEFAQKALTYIPNIDIENNQAVMDRLKNLTGRKSLPAEITTGELSDEGKAPPLTGITHWINSPPLTMQDLKGKVVLIDFWTYSCINCVRTLPYLTRWYNTYKDKGFVIIGVHTPEFEFEKNSKNVEDAVQRFHILYPVAQDNNYGTWQAYSNAYWPAHYLIDQQGNIRQIHFGEGKYLETENAIRSLLHESPLKEEKEIAKNIQPSTPETYLGYSRADRYAPDMTLERNQTSVYSSQNPLEDHVSLKGQWLVTPEYIQSMDDNDQLELNFLAEKVFLVLGGHSDEPITILLDDKPLPPEYYTSDTNDKGQIVVKEPRMYSILDLKNSAARHKLTLRIPKGIQAYAFTFG